MISSFKCVVFLTPVAVAVIRKLLSTIKKLIRMLSDLGACTGGTQVHLIAQDTASIFSQAANQSIDPDERFRVSIMLPFSPVAVAVIRKLLSNIKNTYQIVK